MGARICPVLEMFVRFGMVIHRAVRDTGNLSRLELEVRRGAVERGRIDGRPSGSNVGSMASDGERGRMVKCREERAKLRNLRDMDLDEAVRQRAVDKVERQLAELREDDMGSGVPDDFLEEAKAFDARRSFLSSARLGVELMTLGSVARGITSNSVQNRYLDILESLKLKAFLMNAEKESQVMDSEDMKAQEHLQDEAILLLLAEEAAAKAAASRPVAEYGLRLIKWGRPVGEQARIRQDDAKERKRRVALLRRWVEAGPLSTLVQIYRTVLSNPKIPENWQGQAPEELIAHAHVEEPREPRPPRRDGAVQSLDLADAIELKPLERKRFISAVEEGLKEEEVCAQWRSGLLFKCPAADPKASSANAELVEMEESPLAEDDEWDAQLRYKYLRTRMEAIRKESGAFGGRRVDFGELPKGMDASQADAEETSDTIESHTLRSDLQRALRESLETASARHGTPLGTQALSSGQKALRDMNIYFECQTPGVDEAWCAVLVDEAWTLRMAYVHIHGKTGSDTCGLNALNNLCQRPLFSVEDLQHAEAQHAQVTQGGHFCQRPSLTEVPSGFFDVEALKIAAAAKDLEIVDVEPVSDFRTSRCFSFAEAAAQSMQSSGSGAFLLGFLVYDRQPGQMHYYALKRHEQMVGMWVKLDSQLPPVGSEPRNCLLKEQELWEVYSSCQPLFQSWLLRWYPVVYRKAAVRQVCHVLQERFRHRLSPERATSVLKENGWLVSAAVHHLLETLPVLTLRHLLVKFARPSEAEMQSLLEASGWDLTRAQPAIDRVLKQRIALAKQVDAGETTVEALSLCDWEPRGAAALLALQLHLGEGSSLVELKEALEWAEGEAEKAEAVVKLKAQLGSMESAAKLLHQTHTWSVATATKVLEVRRRFPRANVPVALEVLRRNDDDPHAACEMLEEFRQRIRRTVSEEWDHYLLQGEEAMVADAALDRCGWDPSKAFLAARHLAVAAKSTRKLAMTAVQHPSFSQPRFPIDAVIAALVATDLKPKVAVRVLFGEPQWKDVRQSEPEPEEDDSTCCVA
ncbi:Ubiquitinyl hydrolase 1 [Durusdinium trenchii]|uniref:Ubiquitinyl hydrolase 1 n=1 Tax=Durusdinium trenchii TaxID=1381693 RepID=A0ABP0L3R5_9DINO